jgi:nitrogen fixation protein NifX
MSETTLTRELALRIGLAARELDNVDAALLLAVLDDVVGLPPDEAKLSGLKPGQLKGAAGGALAGQPPQSLKAACAVLRGDAGESVPLPATDAYAEGDMPGSLRVACAANSAELIDGHFGSCRYFLVYQLSAHELRLIDVRLAEEPGDCEDKNEWRAGLIRDVQVLFVASIGGPAAAKVVRAGVHPIKHPQGGAARDRLAELQSRIGANPPPWLARAMGQGGEELARRYPGAAQDA